MHGGDGAEQNRDQRERDPAGVEAEDEGDAAQRLDRDGQIGEGAGQAEAVEELRRAGRREDEDLQAGMGEEQHAERDAKDQGGIGRGAGVDHGGLRSMGTAP